jgi:hypothetical protein
MTKSIGVHEAKALLAVPIITADPAVAQYPIATLMVS